MTPTIALTLAFLAMAGLVVFAFWIDHRRDQEMKKTIHAECSRILTAMIANHGVSKGIHLARATPDGIPHVFGKYWPDGAPREDAAAYQWPYWREDNEGVFIIAYTSDQILRQIQESGKFKPYIPPLAHQAETPAFLEELHKKQITVRQMPHEGNVDYNQEIDRLRFEKQEEKAGR
jgi:hypothetical protein